MAAPCALCCCDGQEGVSCARDDGEPHFLCAPCLAACVELDSSGDVEIGALAARGARLCCPFAITGECSSAPFADVDVARHVPPATFALYIWSRQRLTALRIWSRAQEEVRREVARMARDRADQQLEVESSAILARGLRAQFPDARQCGRCGFGPITHYACADLRTHHGERWGEAGASINNSCPLCGWFQQTIELWPRWDGELRDGERLRWVCAVCTLHNALANERCDACGSERARAEDPHGRLRTVAAERSAGALGGAERPAVTVGMAEEVVATHGIESTAPAAAPFDDATGDAARAPGDGDEEEGQGRRLLHASQAERRALREQGSRLSATQQPTAASQGQSSTRADGGRAPANAGWRGRPRLLLALVACALLGWQQQRLLRASFGVPARSARGLAPPSKYHQPPVLPLERPPPQPPAFETSLDLPPASDTASDKAASDLPPASETASDRPPELDTSSELETSSAWPPCSAHLQAQSARPAECRERRPLRTRLASVSPVPSASSRCSASSSSATASRLCGAAEADGTAHAGGSRPSLAFSRSSDSAEPEPAAPTAAQPAALDRALGNRNGGGAADPAAMHAGRGSAPLGASGRVQACALVALFLIARWLVTRARNAAAALTSRLSHGSWPSGQGGGLQALGSSWLERSGSRPNAVRSRRSPGNVNAMPMMLEERFTRETLAFTSRRC
jgi:hypothetical protein